MLHEVGKVKQNLNHEKHMKWHQTGKNDQSFK